MFRLIRVTVFILFILSYQFIDLRTDAFALTINETTDYFGSTSTATTGLPSDSCNNANNANNAKCFYLLPYGLSQCAVASSSSSFGGMPSSINYTTTPTTTYPYGKLAAIILANYNFGWGRISDPSSDIELGSCRKDPIGACHDTLLICEEDTDIGAAFLILSIVYGENPPSGQYSVTSAQQTYPDSSTHMSPKSYITSVSVTTGTIRKFETIMMYYSSNNLLCNDNYDEPNFDAAWSGTQNDSIDANNDIQEVPPRTLPGSGGPAPVPSWVFISPSSGKTCRDINNTITLPSDGWILGSIMFECANLTRQPAHGLAGSITCSSLVAVYPSNYATSGTINFTINIAYGSGDGVPPLPLGPATVLVTSTYPHGSVGSYSATISSATSETFKVIPPTKDLYNNNETIDVAIKYDDITSTCGTSITPPVAPGGPQPYFQVNGGDTLVGSSYYTNTTCTPDVNSGILSVNNGAPSWLGSSDNIAAVTPNLVYGYKTGVASSAADNLTLSNSSSPPWGGDLGTGLCSQNYYDTRNNIVGLQINSAPSNTTQFYLNKITTTEKNSCTPVDSTYYCYVNGNNVVIDNSPKPGQKLVLYVNGNSSIATNIIMYSSDTSTLASSNSIPLFYLIDNGNIYINSGVTQLDGVYIAQPTSTNSTNSGIIFTCAKYVAAGPSLWGGVTGCKKQLVVNGSLVANQVKLGRTFGSVNSLPNEPAEIVNYSPLVWLSQVENSNLPINAKIQSIQQLSPVL